MFVTPLLLCQYGAGFFVCIFFDSRDGFKSALSGLQKCAISYFIKYTIDTSYHPL